MIMNVKSGVALALLVISLLLLGYARGGTQLQPLEVSINTTSGPRPLASPVNINYQVTRSPTKDSLATPEVIVSATGQPEDTLASTNVLENPKIGYSLFYPDDWHVSNYVKWTEFANGSECESVEVVDLQPPPGSGAGFILHSFVQICAKPLTDKLTLDDFMRQTYEDSATQFQVTDLAGVRAYRSINAERDTTWFLQTNRYRIQIATAVVSKPDKQDMRLSQVQQILASLSFH